MPRILCNLPLECFDERSNLRNIDLRTYGPPHRMDIGGVHFPFDVAFDPSRGSVFELLDALPPNFRPDLLLLWWPDQEPLPRDLHRCPIPVVGIVSDYNLTLPHLLGLTPFFDVLLCDRAGVALFERLGFADVRWFCQFTWKRRFHRPVPGLERDVDVAFAGNLDPVVQRERAPWIDRLAALRGRGVRAEVHTQLDARAYGRLLAQSRIGFNRSIRGEMNLRAFEVPACGALLLMERDNLEVRDFFEPGAECVLYGDDDFEAVVLDLLCDEPRRAAIAAAGHARVQQYALGPRMAALLELLARPGPGRPPADDAAAALGRAEAMLLTWASGEALVEAALDACRRAPDHPRALVALALATLRWRGAAGAAQALPLLQRAVAADPANVAAAQSLAALLGAADRPDLQRAAAEIAARRLAAARGIADVGGPVLPLGFGARSLAWARALQEVARGAPPQQALAAAP